MKIKKHKNIWILRAIDPHMDVVGWEYFLSEEEAMAYYKSNMTRRIKCEAVKYEIKKA